MNTTKRIPMRTNNAARSWYLGLGALIVALVGATGIMAVQADRSNAGAHRVSPPAAVQPLSSSDAPVSNAERPLLTYYLVDSPQLAAMADLLEGEAQAAAMDSSTAAQRRHHVYQITTPEDEAYVSMVIGTTSSELGVAGSWDFQVVDLRNRD